MGEILVTQVRSSIGSKPKHRGTLRALGLRGIGQSNTLPDRPEIRGMIARVPHLITVVPVEDAAPPSEAPGAPPVQADPAPETAAGDDSPAVGDTDESS
jgi:large subunit ribosomal protein L30